MKKKRKNDLLSHFWQWKSVKGELPVAKCSRDILGLRWNDVTKTKRVKSVSMLSNIHTNILADSGKTNHETNETIRKSRVIVCVQVMLCGVDLVNRVIIL